MIITRTPLRISLGGGGTDLPSYYEEAGHGFLIAAAITKYVYIAVNSNFDDDILLKYSHSERVPDIDAVSHPLLRECLRSVGLGRGIEVSSMADIPAGTGLGSSGSFTVGVLKALHMHRKNSRSQRELAEEACHLEINVLKENVGKQDQYIAAYGGVTAFRFDSDGTVQVKPMNLSLASREELGENLLLFYTGVRRSASAVLKQETIQDSSPNVRKENLDATRNLGRETARTLETGNLESFGNLLTEQWKLKFARQPSRLHEQIDDLISEGIRNGALGGKLVGAGGGGFLLFYAPEKAAIRRAMLSHGLEEVRFDIDYEGSAFVTTR